MSRRIKDFGYTDFIKDTMEVDASTIKDMEFPGVRIEAFPSTDNMKDSVVLNYRTVAYANEDEPGIHIKLVKMDQDGHLTDEETKEIVVDEIKFVDEIYNEACKGNTAIDSAYIRNLVFGLMRDYALTATNDTWYFQIEYDCIGFICTGETVIGTVGAIEFDSDEIQLKHCVGSMNLDKVENCNVKIQVRNKKFELSGFTQESMKGENENLNTYIIQNMFSTTISEFPVTEEQLKDFKPYTLEDEEEYVQFRTDFINNNTKEEKSFFGDDIDDLL